MKNSDLFALETVVMAILLSIGSWTALESISHGEAIAAFQVEHKSNNRTKEVVEQMVQSVVRLEEGQKHLMTNMEDNGERLNELTKAVNKLK